MASAGVLRLRFIGNFLTSSAREASAPCDADRTEVGIVAIADACLLGIFPGKKNGKWPTRTRSLKFHSRLNLVPEVSICGQFGRASWGSGSCTVAW